MAPEQLRGRPGPQSDLWALGVVAYRMLTGRLPFPGPSLGDLARQIQYTDPARRARCAASRYRDLEAAVLELLRKSLTERTASAVRTPGATSVFAEIPKRSSNRDRTRRDQRRRAAPFTEKLSQDARRAAWTLAAAVLTYFIRYCPAHGFIYLLRLTVCAMRRSYRTPAKKSGLDAPCPRAILGINTAFGNSL